MGNAKEGSPKSSKECGLGTFVCWSQRQGVDFLYTGLGVGGWRQEQTLNSVVPDLPEFYYHSRLTIKNETMRYCELMIT